MTDWWQTDLKTYVDLYFKSNPKETPLPLFVLCYRCVYLVNSLFRIGLIPPLVSPYHIYISKKGFPMFFIPFFSATYTCQRIYYQNLVKAASEKPLLPSGKEGPLPFASELHHYIYPSFEALPEHGSVTMFLRSCSCYAVSKLVEMEDYWSSLEGCVAHCLTRTLLFVLTGATPLQQAKPTTVPALLALLSNQVKSVPSLAKCIANLKKRVPQNFKTFVDGLGTAVLKPDRHVFKELVAFLEPQMQPEHLLSNSINYSLDILSAACFMEEQSDNLLDAPMRRVIYLPCKLIFNGYFHQKYIEAARFHHGNNLISSFTFDEKDKNTFTCDYYLDENRTLLLKVEKNRLVEADYFLKNSAGADEKGPGERNIKIDRFFEGSWVPTEALWVQCIGKFVKGDAEDSSLCSAVKNRVARSEISFQKNIVASLLTSDRSLA